MTARPPTPAVLHLVPHTHWDREWYEPFQRFRLRLVDMVDGVLDGPRPTGASASPSTGRRPCSRTTWRSGPRPRRASGPWSRPGSSPSAPGGSCRTSSWSRARPWSATWRPGWPGPSGSARSWPSATCPTSSGTPPRSPAPAARRVRARRRLARGAGGGGPPRVPGAPRRLHRPHRVPGRRVRQRGRPVRLPGRGRRRPAAAGTAGAVLRARPGAGHVRRRPRRSLPELLEVVDEINRRQDGYQVRLATLAGYVLHGPGPTARSCRAGGVSCGRARGPTS